MKTKQLNSGGGLFHALVFDQGDAVMAELKKFAREAEIRAARFTAIGAFSEAELAFFNCDSREYEPIPVKEQVEVLVLAGDIAWHAGEPVVHAHAVLGRRDGSTVGGHLKEARVRPTLELMLTEAGALERRHDDATGLALIDLEA